MRRVQIKKIGFSLLAVLTLTGSVVYAEEASDKWQSDGIIQYENAKFDSVDFETVDLGVEDLLVLLEEVETEYKVIEAGAKANYTELIEKVNALENKLSAYGGISNYTDLSSDATINQVAERLVKLDEVFTGDLGSAQAGDVLLNQTFSSNSTGIGKGKGTMKDFAGTTSNSVNIVGFTKDTIYFSPVANGRYSTSSKFKIPSGTKVTHTHNEYCYSSGSLACGLNEGQTYTIRWGKQ